MRGRLLLGEAQESETILTDNGDVSQPVTHVRCNKTCNMAKVTPVKGA